MVVDSSVDELDESVVLPVSVPVLSVVVWLSSVLCMSILLQAAIDSSITRHSKLVSSFFIEFLLSIEQKCVAVAAHEKCITPAQFHN